MPGSLRATRPHTRPHIVFTAASLPHWDKIGPPELMLALAVVLTPLAIGGVHVLTQVICASVLVIGLGLAAFDLHRQGRRVRVGLLGLALMVALGWTFLQWLPLPIGFIAEVSPLAAQSRLDAAALAGLEAPTWVPLTLDAGRTAEAIVSLMALLAAYLLTTSLRSDGHVRQRLVIYLELAALGVLASGIFHEALGATAIWGLYEPITAKAETVAFTTALVNPNHAAAIMLLGALVAFSTSLSPERSQKWHLTVGVLLAAGVLGTMSRANGPLLIAGLLVVVIPAMLARRHKEHRGRAVRLFVGMIACLFVALVLIGPERWFTELASLGSGDFGAEILIGHVWTTAVGVAMHAPWVGVGNGAFQAVAPLYGAAGDFGLVAYAHQGLLQVVADLGWVVGGAVLVLAALGLLRGLWRGFGQLPSWGLGIGVGAVAVQNTVDFSLWIPGVGLVAALAVGILDNAVWPVSKAHGPMNLAWRWPIWASASLIGVLIVVAIPALRDGPELAKHAMREALETRRLDLVDRGALALEHPHDFQVQLLAAALAEQSGLADEARMRTELALATAPNATMTVVAAAKMRLNAGDEHGGLALIERLDPEGRGTRDAIDIVIGASWARRLHEQYFGGHPQRAVEGAQTLRALKRTREANALLEWALVRSPDSFLLHEQLGIARFGEVAFLEELASRCLSKAGLAPEGERAQWERLGYLFQGRVEYLENRDTSAWHLYLASADAVPALAQGALIEAGRVGERAGRNDWLGEAIARLEALDRVGELQGAWVRSEYHFLRSCASEKAGDLGGAIREMHQALRYAGDVPRFHERLAALFEKSNDQDAADRARERARAHSSGAQ